jgi:DnaA-homolog protein
VNGHQLALAVHLPQTADFDNFVHRQDDAAVAALHAGDSAYLFGPAATGKTHLLMAAVRRHDGAYLPLSEALALGAESLAGLDNVPALALDELERLTADPALWMALLRLLDQRLRQQRRTWMAARLPPEQLPALPADLRTRLSQWPRYGLSPLDDFGQRRLLTEAAHRRGLSLPDDVLNWWLRHLPRDAGSLLDTLTQLDRAALREQRRLTLPFVQSVVGWR